MKIPAIFKNPKFTALLFVVFIISILFFALYKSLYSVSPYFRRGGSTPTFLKGKEELQLVQFEPDQGERVTIDAASATGFVFNKPVDEKTLNVNVSPNIKVTKRVYNEKQNEVWVFPSKQLWQSDVTYTITISEGLQSKDGTAILKKPVSYSFVLRFPAEVPYIE